MRWQLGIVGFMAALAGGCSLLLDNGSFVGDGADAGGSDAGMADGGEVDGGPPDAGPDAPTTPEIHIDPATPRTLDDLSVVIDVESTDPLEMGAVTYEYAWTRDGGDSGETSETVSHELTAKDQEWTVYATPVTGDGRRGVPGSANVTIANSAPRVRTVGLSSYRPVVGDLVTALVDDVVDDDAGDVPTLQYTWSLDGTPTTVTGSRFLPTAVPSPAQELTVSVVADDGDELSEAVAAGPAVFLEDVTRWVQHLPNRGETALTLWDQRHGRLLVMIDPPLFSLPPELWEFLPDRDHWVRLRPSGTFPTADFLIAVQDPDENKIYFIASFTTEDFALFELDVSQRGQEVFQSVPFASGAAPPSRGAVTNAFFDEEMDRLIVVTGDPAESDLEMWTVDVSGPEATATLVTDAVPRTVVGSHWVRVPGTREILAFGGGDPTAGTIVANDRVHELDLDDLGSGLVELSETLPVRTAFPLAVADPTGSRILVGYGVTDDGAAVAEAWVFDTESGRFLDGVTVDVSDGPEEALLGWAEGDRWTGRVLMSPGGGLFDPGRAELYDIDLEAPAVSGVHVYGVHVPGPMSGMLGGYFEGAFHFYGGVDPYGQRQDDLWSVDVSAGLFRGINRIDPTPDPIAGVPGPRTSVVLDGQLEDLVFLGGSTEGGYADSTVWRYSAGAWTAFQTATGQTPPAARRGHVIARPACADELLYTTGQLETGGFASETGSIDCSGSTTGCTWRIRTSTGAPPETSFASSHRSSSVLYVIGGTGNPDGVSAYDSCAETWADLPIGGTWVGRWGASLTGSYLFGGQRSETYFNDIYELVVTSEARFEPVTVASDGDGLPAPRWAHVAAYASSGGLTSIFIYGGNAGTAGFFREADYQYGDLWQLRIR